MNYLEFKAKHEELNREVDTISDKLNSFDWKNEAIRMSKDFQSLQIKFDAAFKTLQNFNQVSSKEFKKALSKERRNF